MTHQPPSETPHVTVLDNINQIVHLFLFFPFFLRPSFLSILKFFFYHFFCLLSFFQSESKVNRLELLHNYIKRNHETHNVYHVNTKAKHESHIPINMINSDEISSTRLSRQTFSTSCPVLTSCNCTTAALDGEIE